MNRKRAARLERALPDAGIERIRPVLITVSATILALFPLALEGGPLWKPLCYAQIGGLAVATLHHLALGPRLLRDFCTRPEVDPNGRERQGRPRAGPGGRANNNVTNGRDERSVRRSWIFFQTLTLLQEGE